MPYAYVEPEVYLTHRGIHVYYTYRNDNADEPRRYWFSTDASEDFSFDVRDLMIALEKNKLIPDNQVIEDDEEIMTFIRLGLDHGLIKLPDNVQLGDLKLNEKNTPFLDSHLKSGILCPFCGQENIEGGFVETGFGRASQVMGCNDCDRVWTDIYTIHRIEIE
ncbi:MAG: hypothetical protein M0036_19165 [Desulfobacteraceae bacterium]|nr:hypothetical protein [Desulfobacteraceae bacterium]